MQKLDPVILWLARELLGVPIAATSAEVISRLGVEVKRFEMGTGAFHNRPKLLEAFMSNDAPAFALELGFTQLPDMVTIPRAVFEAMHLNVLTTYRSLVLARNFLT